MWKEKEDTYWKLCALQLGAEHLAKDASERVGFDAIGTMTHIQSPARKLVFGFGGLLEIVYPGAAFIIGSFSALCPLGRE